MWEYKPGFCVASLHGCRWIICSAFWRTSVGTDQLPLVQYRVSVKAELALSYDILFKVT